MSYDGAALTPQNAGYFEGTTDVYFALMTGMDALNQAPEYDDGVCLGKSIEIQVTPNYRERKVYASNAATRREQVPDSYTVALNLDQVIPERRAALLGRPVDDNGVELITGKNMGPWVALMFAATLDDGTKEYWTLYKGRFSEPTNTHHTKNDGDSYQHPQLTGTFVRLGNNDRIANVLSEAALISVGSYGTRNVNLIRGTFEGYSGPAGDLSEAPEYPASEYGKALTAGDSTHYYFINYTVTIRWTGSGTMPSISSAGSISPKLKFADGGSASDFGKTFTALPNKEICRAQISPTQMAAHGAIASVELGGTGWQTEGWEMEISGVMLVQGSTSGVNPNPYWTPAPEDCLEHVVQI